MPQQHSIILFDGLCNLCNGAINFVIDRDKKGMFRFASLQSAIAKELLKQYKVPAGKDSIVLIENDKFYSESTAALRIAKNLKAPWPALYAFMIVPRFIRDAVYRLIAANRYKWFGVRDTCRVPEPGIKEKFLE